MTPAEPLLLDELHRIQSEHGWLPEPELAALAAHRRLPAASLHDFVSFFHGFHLSPASPTIRVCTGPACVLAGSRGHLNTPDAVPVPCLGRCDEAPVALSPDLPSPTPELPEYPNGHWAWLDAFSDPDSLEDLLAAVEKSGLGGMGGAGFPTAKKLAAVRSAPGADKVVIANGDEGEPGTFKDRYLLKSQPDRVLAGVVLACRLVGAARAFVYVRDEYAVGRAALERAATHLREQGVTAKPEEPPTPAVPAITLVRAAGPYICGEETALIASLEGRRGEPAPGPPYPAQKGLWGHPTLVQNVETLAYLARIARDGAEAYRVGGPGLRHYSVSGAVARPGVYELPRNVTARQVLEAAAGAARGHSIQAFIPGGGASGLLSATALGTPLTGPALEKLGTAPGTGGVVFVPESACVVDLAAGLMGFYAAESCGQCDPCRLGTRELAAALSGLTHGTPLNEERIGTTSAALATLSICGLGRWAPVVPGTLLRHFPEQVAAHGVGTCPAGICPMGNAP